MKIGSNSKSVNSSVNPHVKGAKLDQGKNRLSLVLGAFAKALWAVGEVGTFGANKYTDNGWQHVENRKARYEDAMLRHWAKIHMGELRDDESGLYHAAHLAWNALAYLFATIEENESEPKASEEVGRKGCDEAVQECSDPEDRLTWKESDIERREREANV